MKILKPKFWDQKNNFISFIFYPISLLIGLLIFFKKKLIRTHNYQIPIICVGNIYIGGTGKTPLSIEIAKLLTENKVKAAIIKKYYEDQSDERELILSKAQNLFSEKSRDKAINNAINNNYNVLIMDDGSQEYSIKKNLNILCFNSRSGIGNGKIFPAGPLREPLSFIKNYQIAIINGSRNPLLEKTIKEVSKNIKIFYSRYKIKDLIYKKNENIIAFAGIGDPDSFFELMIENKFNILSKYPFPDHYDYKLKDLEKILDEAKKERVKIYTTEKDFIKIKKFNLKNVNCVKVELIIENSDQFSREILNEIN